MIENEYQIVYLLANIFQTFLIYKIFCIFNVKRNNVILMFLSCALYFIFTSLFYLLYNIPILTMFVNIVFLFLISLNFRCKLWQKLLNVVLIYILLMIVESVAALFVSFFDKLENNSFAFIYALLISKMCTFALVFLMDMRKKTLDKIEVSLIYKISLFTFPFGSIVIFHALLAEDHKNEWLFLSLFILFIFNIFITFLYDVLYTKYMKELDNQLLINQNKYYMKQMALMNENSSKIQILNHDYKNHLISLYGFLDLQKYDEMKDYLDNLINSNNDTLLVETGNLALDSILNYKLSYATNAGIKIKTEIKVPNRLGFNPIDLNILIGNLLDNAIEANLKLSHQNKHLHIEMEYDRSMLFISIQNACNTIILDNGKLSTTKKDHTNHGLGLKSIHQVVSYYNGFIEYTLENQTFKTFLMLYEP